jgi:hypothetical protein
MGVDPPDDYMFVYYDDHGDDNILGDQLAAAFKTSAAAGVYKALLFGIEACYAGTHCVEHPGVVVCRRLRFTARHVFVE